MNNKKTGYVYILTSPSFREDWVKIGKNIRPVDVRSKELDKELDNNAMLAQDSCPLVHNEDRLWGILQAPVPVTIWAVNKTNCEPLTNQNC